MVAPYQDYHWARQNADGTWSHKPGGTAVVNVDDANLKITNPSTADWDGRYSGRPYYEDCCIYFEVGAKSK